MQTTMKIWITSFSYISLGEFSSFNHINFFQYFYLVVEPLTRGWRNGASLIYLFLLGFEALGILDW
jgi:hypothetical protein